MNRRALLCGASAFALSGCSQTFSEFANNAYVSIHVVAKKLEQAIKLAATNMTAAVAMMEPYVVPACRLFVAIVTLAGQIAAVNPALAENAKFMAVYSQANILAQNAVVQAAAESGQIPTDSVTILQGVIQLSGQISVLTRGNASPSIAAQRV